MSGLNTSPLYIGNVFISNGRDKRTRSQAAEVFGFSYEEMDKGIPLIFGIYEEGKPSLDEYLYRLVFCKERQFKPEDTEAVWGKNRRDLFVVTKK